MSFAHETLTHLTFYTIMKQTIKVCRIVIYWREQHFWECFEFLHSNYFLSRTTLLLELLIHQWEKIMMNIKSIKVGEQEKAAHDTPDTCRHFFLDWWYFIPKIIHFCRDYVPMLRKQQQHWGFYIDDFFNRMMKNVII